MPHTERHPSQLICDRLSGYVTGTTYIHTSPDDSLNAYRVVTRNTAGCSYVDDDNPALLSDAR